MFKIFSSKFSIDSSKVESTTFNSKFKFHGMQEFFNEFGGASFNNGLYRVHSANELEKWNEIVGQAFPEFSDRIICFSYDWLGRHFALDKERTQDGEPLILLLEPGTGEVLEIPANFLSFHNEILIEFTNEAVALDFFNSWFKKSRQIIKTNECVGYTMPLFLGGQDTVKNLEIIDLEVYWSISGQLLNKIKDLPPGSAIGNISIE